MHTFYSNYDPPTTLQYQKLKPCYCSNLIQMYNREVRLLNWWFALCWRFAF